MQSPATRKLLTFAGKLPSGSPEIELIAKELGAKAGQIGTTPIPKNVTPFNPALSPAASTEPNSTLAENK